MIFELFSMISVAQCVELQLEFKLSFGVYLVSDAVCCLIDCYYSCCCPSLPDLVENWLNNDMIGETGMVDNFDVSLSSSFIRKKKKLFFFLMKLELSETSKLSTIPVSPIMSKFTFSRECVQGWWVRSSKVCFSAMADCISAKSHALNRALKYHKSFKTKL